MVDTESSLQCSWPCRVRVDYYQECFAMGELVSGKMQGKELNVTNACIYAQVSEEIDGISLFNNLLENHKA